MSRTDTMIEYSPEKILGVFGGAIGAALGAFKFWKAIRPKIQARRAARRARLDLLENLSAKLAEISERQSRMELTLSFSHVAGEMTLLLAGIAAWKSDLQGNAIYISPALADLLNLDQQSARGAGWQAALHPEDRAVVTQDYRDAVASRRMFSSYYRYKHQDGRIVYVHGVAYPAANPINNSVQEFWGRAKEITKEEFIQRRV